MLDIKYGANLTIPGGPQFSISNQVLQIEVYKHFSITLNAIQLKEEITLTDAKKLNLLSVKATSTLAKDSLSKLTYSIDTGKFVELDAPILILGSWVNFIIPDSMKMSFELKPKPADDSKDSITVDIIVGWAEAD
jgi:hypothetical protein